MVIPSNDYRKKSKISDSSMLRTKRESYIIFDDTRFHARFSLIVGRIKPPFSIIQSPATWQFNFYRETAVRSFGSQSYTMTGITRSHDTQHHQVICQPRIDTRSSTSSLAEWNEAKKTLELDVKVANNITAVISSI